MTKVVLSVFEMGWFPVSSGVELLEGPLVDMRLVLSVFEVGLFLVSSGVELDKGMLTELEILFLVLSPAVGCSGVVVLGVAARGYKVQLLPDNLIWSMNT
jgi:Kef-type K+ transport system membrane component KefB